jgi:hypothetical protein
MIDADIKASTAALQALRQFTDVDTRLSQAVFFLHMSREIVYAAPDCGFHAWTPPFAGPACTHVMTSILLFGNYYGCVA